MAAENKHSFQSMLESVWDDDLWVSAEGVEENSFAIVSEWQPFPLVNTVADTRTDSVLMLGEYESI